MTHGATFLKGNYELPSARDPVRLSRERWEMLITRAKISSLKGHIDYSTSEDRVSVFVPTETRGVIFLPAEYVLRSGADVLAESRADCNRRLAILQRNRDILDPRVRA